MIKVALAFLVRGLVDLGLVLFAVGAVFLVVGFRVARRFVTPEPDKLDLVTGQLARLLTIGLVASRRAGQIEPADSGLWEDELDELTPQEREQSIEFWRSVVV